MLRSLALLSFASLAASGTDAAVVAHDSIAVWPEPTPQTMSQQLGVKFKPQIEYDNSCNAYPAVDAAGNTSGGLAPSGSPGAGCSDRSKQQIYARTGTYNSTSVVMYSWYMPKDSPSTGLGHRHEWENVVVWLSSANPSTATMVGAAASAHGGYKKMTTMNWDYVDSQVSTKIWYHSNWPVNHELFFTSDAGEKQPLIQWDQLTDAARNALEATDFGSATVPFKNSNFNSNLALAWYK